MKPRQLLTVLLPDWLEPVVEQVSSEFKIPGEQLAQAFARVMVADCAWDDMGDAPRPGESYLCPDVHEDEAWPVEIPYPLREIGIPLN